MRAIKLPTGSFEYDPAKPLGKAGGFGQVFLGESYNGEEVAVKKLHLSAADVAHRELEIAAELKGHPFEHVVPFIDAGEDAESGEYYVVMPKAGDSLETKIDNEGPLSPEEATSVLLQISKGLIEVGILVHRDLKPDNILFHENKWKVADFGIARFVEEITSRNTLKGYLSDHYAAPEQWRYERATHATDVYALGCIAFFLLTGRPPYTENPQDEHQNASVPAFDCTEQRLVTLINMCLRKVANSRPSLSRVRDLLEEIIVGPKLKEDKGALGALAAAAAQVSTEEQEEQASKAAAETKQKKRSDLAASGFDTLGENIERLWDKIHTLAPNATRISSNGSGTFECQIGVGKLVVNLSRSNSLGSDSFHYSGWDVLAFSQIVVIQSKPKNSWSASLWFTNLKGKPDYRWYEASYWQLNGNTFWPYAEQPGRDADMAASGIMCSVNFAFGPIPIDDEKEDGFHERWIWLLSKAATGELRAPSSMPYGWPPY